MIDGSISTGLSEPEDLRDWVGEIVRERVIVGDRVYLLDRPAQSEKLLDGSADSGGDVLPYWADLWPGAIMLAKTVARETWAPGTETLEIGCGLGLPGIVGLSVGLKVTLSDYDATALRFASHNVRLNGFTEVTTQRLDWCFPPDGLQVPVLLASDLVYELANVEPLVNFVKKVLAPGGLCLLTDQDRLPANALREAIGDSGLAFTTEIVRISEPGQRRLKGTLYRIRQT